MQRNYAIQTPPHRHTFDTHLKELAAGGTFRQRRGASPPCVQRPLVGLRHQWRSSSRRNIDRGCRNAGEGGPALGVERCCAPINGASAHGDRLTGSSGRHQRTAHSRPNTPPGCGPLAAVGSSRSASLGHHLSPTTASTRHLRALLASWREFAPLES